VVVGDWIFLRNNHAPDRKTPVGLGLSGYARRPRRPTRALVGATGLPQFSDRAAQPVGLERTGSLYPTDVDARNTLIQRILTLLF